MQSAWVGVDKLIKTLGHSDLNVEAVLQDGYNLPSNPADRATHMNDSHDIMKAQIIFTEYDKYC